jgi:EAL and modified HD-GYP domain-containing signal transduction protein
MNPLSRLAALCDPTGYLGRQPIYDANREIHGYELLYRRSSGDSTAQIRDGDRASAEVILRAFLEIGLPAVSSARPVFINYPEALLAEIPIIPPERCVIEVLETVTANRRNVAHLAELKGHGYRIALDDFEYSDEKVPFLPLADYVKLDIRTLTACDFERHLAVLKEFKLAVIAEKVETQEEFQRCREWGCTLFQGYYLRKPELLSGKRMPSSQLAVLALLTKCLDGNDSVNAIAEIIERDVTLVYGLLRLANSALYGRQAQIQSPAHAVALLGIDRVFRWVTLLVLVGQSNCPRGYLEFALQRARMCELIAVHYDCARHQAYMTGMLSALDSVCGAPLPDLVEPLPLDDRLKQAILDHSGPLGAVLNTALAYETCQQEFASRHKIRLDAAQKAFWEAAAYAAAMLADLSGAGHAPGTVPAPQAGVCATPVTGRRR